jgi:putative hydrolase of the HAD superfamily
MERSTAAALAPALDWGRIDHVLLDMDGTILDLAFDNHFWLTLVPQRYAQSRGLSAEQAWKELEPHFTGLQGRLEWYCLDHWSRFTGLDLAALKAEVRERIAILPGSEPFLDAVRASGRSLWLVTNAHRGSWELKMAQTGLAGHFDRILCAHDFGMPKEDARFWPALRAQHAFDPARALFVDDSLSVLRSARNYGIGAIRAIRHPDSSQPKRVIEEFEAVDRLGELLPVA